MENRLIQEKAIRIFEEQFHCRLCCHDYSGQLQGVPLPQYHLNPFCTGLKEHKNKLTELCIEFDRDKVQHQLLRTHPRPFFKCCIKTENFMPCFFSSASNWARSRAAFSAAFATFGS